MILSSDFCRRHKRREIKFLVFHDTKHMFESRQLWLTTTTLFLLCRLFNHQYAYMFKKKNKKKIMVKWITRQQVIIGFRQRQNSLKSVAAGKFDV